MLDAWTTIAGFIEKDKDRCQLLMTCKEISKCDFYFYKFIFAKKIIEIPWFDHFVNVIVEDIVVLPRSVIGVCFWYNYKKSINGMIPSTVKRVFFDDDSGEGPIIDECLPTSVTYLRFGENFNKPIDGKFIPSVTHIVFGIKYNQPLDNLPPSLTHIKFDNVQSNSTINFLKAKSINISYNVHKEKNYSEFSWKRYFRQFD